MKVTEDKPIKYIGPTIHCFLSGGWQGPWMGSQSLHKYSATYIKIKVFFLLKLTWVYLWTANLYKYIYTGRHFTHYLLNHLAFIKELGGKKAYKLFTRTKNPTPKQTNKQTNQQTNKSCLVSKERHNSVLGKFLNTVILTCVHDSKEIESLQEKHWKKCIPYPLWLQCLKQLMWSNSRLDPQIKDKAGQSTQS